MHGVRVVELAIWVAGPSGAGILADWGADVIKIESPQGDPIRGVQAVLGDVPNNPMFEPENRGKRSIVLDFRQAADRETALQLIDDADVFVTNMRTAALTRLGLDHETLLARDPGLIYALVTGQGLTGPDAGSGSYDIGAYWARGGIADILSVPGHEVPMQRSGMGDHFAGVTVAGMISAALYHREKTGEGQLVSTSLLRLATYQICSDFNMKLMLDTELPHSERAKQDNPIWNNYAAGDGKRFWLLGVESDRHWPTLARIVGGPTLENDPRFATRIARKDNSAALIELLDKTFASQPREYWGKLFDAEKDFFWSPVNTLDEVLADPQTRASGAIVMTEDGSFDRPMIASPVDFHGSPGSVRTRAPRLGEHTDEILAELTARDPAE
jgi:crotonobetainyl-CoA:carnitine CoA-transferase CaiB-like acyl-CoA transferase